MKSSIAARVPEPGSRTMKRLARAARAPARSRRARTGARASATSTCGCIAKGSAREGQFLRRPAHDGEVDLALAHQRRPPRSRLSLTCRRISTPRMLVAEVRQQARHEVLRGADHRRRRAPRSSGLAKRAITSSASLHGREHPLRVDQDVLPDHGQRDLAAARSNSGRPTSASSSLICIETAGGVRCELLGGAHEAQLPGHRRKDPQLAEGDVLHSVFLS